MQLKTVRADVSSPNHNFFFPFNWLVNLNVDVAGSFANYEGKDKSLWRELATCAESTLGLSAWRKIIIANVITTTIIIIITIGSCRKLSIFLLRNSQFLVRPNVQTKLLICGCVICWFLQVNLELKYVAINLEWNMLLRLGHVKSTMIRWYSKHHSLANCLHLCLSQSKEKWPQLFKRFRKPGPTADPSQATC